MNGQQTDGLYGLLIVDDAGADYVAAGATPGFTTGAAEWHWLLSDWYDFTMCSPTCRMPALCAATPP